MAVKNVLRFVFAVLSLHVTTTAMADPLLDRCLLNEVNNPDNEQLTVADLQSICHQQVYQNEKIEQKINSSSLLRRATLERQEENPFTLLPHRPSYLLFAHNFSDANEAPFDQADPDRDYDFQSYETKFQISLKVPVIKDITKTFGIPGFKGVGVYAAYTNRSFWQQFNKEGSAPFRDSNHEPELWLSWQYEQPFLGFTNRFIRFGINHQSNGQSGSLSRSWNRLYTEFLFERDDFAFSFKPWWRIPDRGNDDNPDIEDYLGNFEFSTVYKNAEYSGHSLELILRNNLNFSENRGAIQLGWTFPIYKSVSGYLQWFNGYGESLIDYNSHTNSLGLGIRLADWL
jgi:phospholipase A1